MSVGFDNAAQVARIRARLRAYGRLGVHAVRSGISPLELFATKFPYVLPDRRRPASLSVELTDACNLKCEYCTNPLFAHPRSFLDETSFAALLSDLDRFPVARIRVCGGEPTLHPEFARYSAELARRARFVSVVTNAQWRHSSLADTLAEHYDLVEVSIDAGGARQYEQSRAGASYDRLSRNLRALREACDRAGSSTLVNIRLMVRPSTEESVRAERSRWSAFADSVMVQYVIEQRSQTSPGHDVFVPVQLSSRSIPRCTMPFKDLAVRVDGTIPVCHVNGTHLDPSRRIVVGRLGQTELEQAWTGTTMRRVRRAHRRREESRLEFCRGCSGR